MGTLHRILRKPFFGRFEAPWTWPEGTDRSTWERVSFKNGSGTQLAGLWGPAHGEGRATLVLAHPMGKSAKGFWLRHGHAELFRREGYNVLLFDANGFGESAAASFDYPADILAAGQWAQARTPSLPVGLVGASFGAGWGLCSMARAGSPYRAAVLEAAFPTLPDFWRHYPVAHALLRASQLLWPSLERDLRPERDAAKVLGEPEVLLIYGDQDRYTPPAHGERLAKAFGNAARVQMSVFEGVDHTFALRDAPQKYAPLVLGFLRQSTAAKGGVNMR
jgi:pimeloyl-ACP methyl ester carboxylesterase